MTTVTIITYIMPTTSIIITLISIMITTLITIMTHLIITTIIINRGLGCGVQKLWLRILGSGSRSKFR
jgi:hypothetical protein